MKINGVVIEDEAAGKFFVFIEQFPGICAQADSFEEADTKVNTYYQAFIDRIKTQQVSMDKSHVTTI